MKFLASLLLAACVLNTRAASYRGPEIGDEAPPLKIEQWLQAPAKAAAGWPVGQVVILEFWATWCGPCVEAIPHLNELAEQFKGKSVQFIAVTDEEKSVVQSFLKKTPVKAWIGLVARDTFGDMHPYGVYAIPHTVIIDPKGRVAAVISPLALNSNLIELCLAGKPLLPTVEAGITGVQSGSQEPSTNPDICPFPGVVPGQSAIGRTPMFQVMIRPIKESLPSANAKSSGETKVLRYSKGEFGLTMPNSQLEAAILFVFGMERARMVRETNLPTEQFDFYISLPPRFIGAHERHGKLLETSFSQAVEATFGLSVQRETRTVLVLVLRANAASAEKLAKSSNDGKAELYDWNDVVGINRSLGSLAEGLEHAVATPVLDETGITNLYSFHLHWDQKDRQHPNLGGARAAVTKLGLELTPEKRPLELVVVRAASK